MYKNKRTFLWVVLLQRTFTCSNSTVETLEKCAKICLKLTIKTSLRQRRHSDVFLVNFKHNSLHFLVILLLTLNMYLFAGSFKAEL